MELYKESIPALVSDVDLNGASSERLISLMDKITDILMERGCFVSLNIESVREEDEMEASEQMLDLIEYEDNHLDEGDN